MSRQLHPHPVWAQEGVPAHRKLFVKPVGPPGAPSTSSLTSKALSQVAGPAPWAIAFRLGKDWDSGLY